MGDSINLKIQVPSEVRMKGDNVLQKHLTFETVCEWIKLQELDEYTTNGLIEIAAKYPNNALHGFRRNFNLMIARVRSKRKREQGELENAKEKEKN